MSCSMSAWVPPVGVVVGAEVGAAGARVAVGAGAIGAVMIVVAGGAIVVLGRGVVVGDVSDVSDVGGAVGATRAVVGVDPVAGVDPVVVVGAGVEVVGCAMTTLDASAEAAEGLARSPVFSPQAESPATRTAVPRAVATRRCGRRGRAPGGGSAEVFMPVRLATSSVHLMGNVLGNREVADETHGGSMAGNTVSQSSRMLTTAHPWRRPISVMGSASPMVAASLT